MGYLLQPLRARVEAEERGVEELREVPRQRLRLLQAALEVLRQRARVRNVVVPAPRSQELNVATL